MEEVHQTEIGTGKALPTEQRPHALLGRLDQNDLRRGIMLMEILGPPVSMKRSQQF